jgi:hypothetical protein
MLEGKQTKSERRSIDGPYPGIPFCCYTDPSDSIEPVRNFERIVQILTELDRDDRLTADQKPCRRFESPNKAASDEICK